MHACAASMRKSSRQRKSSRPPDSWAAILQAAVSPPRRPRGRCELPRRCSAGQRRRAAGGRRCSSAAALRLLMMIRRSCCCGARCLAAQAAEAEEGRNSCCGGSSIGEQQPKKNTTSAPTPGCFAPSPIEARKGFSALLVGLFLLSSWPYRKLCIFHLKDLSAKILSKPNKVLGARCDLVYALRTCGLGLLGGCLSCLSLYSLH
jgi:hypothetical protein